MTSGQKPKSRTPPKSVRRLLRQQAQFTCAYPDCSNPYLEYHHFDPPWHIDQHHYPSGMIALCATHHTQADNGNFTIEQLRDFKARLKKLKYVEGKFNYLRNNMAISGGSIFAYKMDVLLEINGVDVVWLSKDNDGYYRVNINLPNIRILENDWITPVENFDVDSPPNGKRLEIITHSKDKFVLEFLEAISVSDFAKYEDPDILDTYGINLPITIVRFEYYFRGTGEDEAISIGKSEISLPGPKKLSNIVMVNGKKAIRFSYPMLDSWNDVFGVNSSPTPENIPFPQYWKKG